MERARAWEWVKDPPAGEGQVGQKQHCRAVTSFPLMVKGKAWLGIKDPPAGEGQVGQKHLFGEGETGRIKNARRNFQLTFEKKETKKARFLEKETSLKAWIQVSFTGLPRIQN